MTRHSHAQLTAIPTVRHTMSEVAAAEAEIRANYVAQYGTEPGLIWIRETALALLDERAGESK